MTESHLVAASLAAGGRPLVLKDGETFAVFGQAGEIRPDGLGEEGLFHEGTRFLSHFTLELERHRLLYLDSSIGPVGQIMKVMLTPPLLLPKRASTSPWPRSTSASGRFSGVACSISASW